MHISFKDINLAVVLKIPSYLDGIICFTLSGVDSATKRRLSHMVVTVSPSPVKK